jgi:hypothetical protein
VPGNPFSFMRNSRKKLRVFFVCFYMYLLSKKQTCSTKAEHIKYFESSETLSPKLSFMKFFIYLSFYLSTT